MPHLRKLIAVQIFGAATLLTHPVAAQTALNSAEPAPPVRAVVVENPSSAPEASDAGLMELEKVEVTGTRIRTLGGEATAIPVFSIARVELERRGVTRLAD